MNQNDSLFTPISIGKLKLSGRVIKSAMVETLCTKEGFVTPELVEHYQQIAQGGTPLIITGAANYNLYGRGVPHQLSVDHDDKLPGLTELTKGVHELGGKIMAQIYHTSRQALPNPVGRQDAQAPSAVYEPSLGVSPREISLTEIKQNITEFSEAALRCKKAGFDGVQIHAAHGYLISGFLTPHTNRRKDEYGGSFENRMRFLLEVYEAVREKVGEDFPLILKINGSDDLPFRKGLSTQELIKVALRMEQVGIDGVEITAGHYESGTTFSRGNWKGFTKTMLKHGLGPSLSWGRRNGMTLVAPLVDWYFNKISGYKEAFNLEYAKQFTQALSVPVICVGGFVNKSTMEKALSQGDCDMVAVARGFIADPYLYRNMKENRQGPKCNYCNACFARPGVQPLKCYEPKISAQREKMLNEPFYKEVAHS